MSEKFGERPKFVRCYVKILEYETGSTGKRYNKAVSITVYRPLEEVQDIVRRALSEAFGSAPAEDRTVRTVGP